jgi:hypothetical protein
VFISRENRGQGFRVQGLGNPGQTGGGLRGSARRFAEVYYHCFACNVFSRDTSNLFNKRCLRDSTCSHKS